MAFGTAAFGQDLEQVMLQAQVPQRERIAVGLFDTLVTILGMKIGAIKFKQA